jgi:hypothetical protein
LTPLCPIWTAERRNFPGSDPETIYVTNELYSSSPLFSLNIPLGICDALWAGIQHPDILHKILNGK